MVCVDYSDFLAWSLPWNKRHFDHMVVVTSPHDHATQRLCNYHHIKCVLTEIMYKDGAAFHKAAAINVGLEHLSRNGYVCHIDADIVLPPRAREMFEYKASIKMDAIYTIDRMMCPSFEEWVKFVGCPEVQHDDQIFIKANAFPLGVRVGNLGPDGEGFTPIGFFQLWHPGYTARHDYPMEGRTVARSDMVHSLRWNRKDRVLIPEVVAIHLESEPAAMGTNWFGRKTKFFGIPSEREERGKPPSRAKYC